MAKQHELAEVSAPLGRPASDSIPQIESIPILIEKLSHPDVSAEKAQFISQLIEKFCKMNAEIQFNRALAAFQADCPPIPKSRRVDVVTKRGAVLKYDYAPLDVIEPIVRPALAKHGLSYSFSALESPPGTVQIECTMSHDGGHSQSYKGVVAPVGEGITSPQQRSMGAGTTSRRSALVYALGLPLAEPDLDGNEPYDAGSDDVPCSEEEAAKVGELIAEYNRDLAKFLAFESKQTGREHGSLMDLSEARARHWIREIPQHGRKQ